ncbi:Ubiquitin-conjugating enzyme family protein [Tritrichomonas foetus]|uniref:E2 NEDD8-conjugating enzyme n=1 Tax=Tritrichomonas foetus TaxID=1144522 RepID=A0A1J4JYW5_9EUKA|nr:Ubiquitin-conjugating enzyme family protein [Tritrichomonas foetus]|eukprot:OHT04359.1 Ubiquitin-conjugating enzyme family protein [Tritrichomonas foetus]
MSRVNRSRRASLPKSSHVSMRDSRLQKDIDDLDSSVKVSFPNPNDLKHFITRIIPDSGLWKGGVFDFDIKIPEEWPIEPPEVSIITRVWHPNLSENGDVCLSLLSEHYTPVISISHIIAGLQYLFCEPNPRSPLNNEAAMQMFADNDLFETTIREYIDKYCDRI